MKNFQIEFARPWLLLLLIPALVLAFLPHFLSKRKYRRNRNRIISLSLHTLISVLCVFLLAGITFSYNVQNGKNEILLLVDCSYSTSEQRDAKNEYVRSIVDEGSGEFKIGIVKFGYDQKYVAPLSSDADVFDKYMSSDDPDTSATDIASALKYAQTLFTRPSGGKIVLISDGWETDGKADSVIKSVAADGIKVDTVFVPNGEHDEVQIVGVKTPDYNIKIGDKFHMELSVVGNVKGGDEKAVVTVFDSVDNAAESEGKEHAFTLESGKQTVKIEHSFDVPGLHKLRFSLRCAGDTLAQNNTYYTYIRIATTENILIIEKDKGETDALRALLEQEYEVTPLSLDQDMALLPKTINELCEYRQIILANIANSDLARITDELGLAKGYDELLDEYVRVEGGGLFTVGGKNDTNDKGEIVPHAYNRDDLTPGNTPSLYHQMLPVQAVNYTPPVAVMIVIDSSGSMGTDENSPMYFAKNGAKTVFDVLDPRDYCGVMTLTDTATELLAPTQVSHKAEIEAAINRISAEGDGGTMYSPSIERAGMVLSGVNVQRKHILLVTDGEPNDGEDDYLEKIGINRGNGITMSIVAIRGGNGGSYNSEMMAKAAEAGGGILYECTKVEDIAVKMKEDLTQNAVEDIRYGEPFSLFTGDLTPALEGIAQEDLPVVYGYYGTRAKTDADVPLWCACTPDDNTETKAATNTQRVPFYAQHTYGEGKVGSLLCSVSGEWSVDFMASDAGQRFFRNVVTGLFPTKDIRKSDIKAVLREDNYTNQLSVYTQLQEGDRIEVTVTPVTEEARDAYRQNPVSVTASDGYTSFAFAARVPGIYEIDVRKLSADGAELSKLTLYKSLCYSEEYDMFPEVARDGKAYLAALAKDGRGVAVEDVFDVFDSFVRHNKRVYDPRILFLVLTIVAFLLDVAVRKFKFKWLHEIVRDRKEKKALKESKN